MNNRSELQGTSDELAELYRDGLQLLEALDRLGLYQAGAHLAMAIEAIRHRRPDLPPFE